MHSFDVLPLDYRNNEQLLAVSAMHEKLLSDSPLAKLGMGFMKKFYYNKLIKEGLLKCDLGRCEGRYIAFIAYTKYPYTFMEDGKRKYFMYLSFLLLRALLCNPLRLKTIFDTIKIGNRRRLERGKDPDTGEILSLGVLEPYRHPKDSATGLRISNLLVDGALAYFKKEGLRRMQGEVRKDNIETLLFWKAYNAVIDEKAWGRDSCCQIALEL